MFIYHFNRMIRSKILWIIFAVIIAVAFLSVDSCRGGRDAGASYDDARNMGEIGGVPVTYEEYEIARRVISNMSRDLPPAATETQIFAHVAAMRAAAEMGLSVGARELSDLIASIPDFQVNGVFDKARYEQVVSSALSASPRTFERMQSEYLLLSKLRGAVTAGSAASKMAIDEEVGRYTDRFTFRYATLSNAFAEAEIEIGDDALREHYEANKATYALPERVQVRYISLPVTNFTAAVDRDELVADADDIYVSDPSAYTRQGTNGVEQLTLEEARPQILDELVAAEAVHIAVTNLAAFMDTLATNDLESFTWRSKARGFEPRDTPLFAFDAGYIPGVEAAAINEFRDAAGELDMNRADSAYGIARGRRNVYLMRIVTNAAAYTPTCESLTDTLRPAVLAEKRKKLFEDAAEETAGKISAAIADGKDFADACAGLSLTASTGIVFSATAAMPDAVPEPREVVPVVVAAKTGTLAKPAYVRDGAVLAFVDAREPVDSFETASAREMAARQISEANDSLFFANWLLWNLTDRGFHSKPLDSILADNVADEEEEE